MTESDTNHKVVLEIQDETLGKNIIDRLQQWGYDVTLNRQGDVYGTPTKEYKVTASDK